MATGPDLNGRLNRRDRAAPPIEPAAIDIVVGDLQAGLATPDGTQVQEQPDGSILVLDAPEPERPDTSRFDTNLADAIGETDLSILASDILQGIDDDLQSRAAWVDTYVKGMDLLGLKIEERSNAKFRKRTSTVRHSVLLESVVKFQSMARAEMLPAAGPAKIRNDAKETAATNELAQDFETDFNHYLTTTATEFYPDTDRMLFYLGFGGTTYKKIYRCPIRQRPVSEAVYLPDLIVSNEVTDLQNATRVTQQIRMTKTKVKELQIAGQYRDVDLMTPSPDNDRVQQKVRDLEGRSQSQPSRPDEIDRTIYECYVFLPPVVPETGAPKGLPLPYRVTLDKDSRVILEIRRAWKSGDEQFRKRRFFVKFGLIPGFGFMDFGYLHLLGNQTRALTAMLRLMIDAGMFASFPGGVKLKGSRASTNEIAPGPGEWIDYDVPASPDQDIRRLLMALPYKDISPVLLQLYQDVAQDAMRLAGAVEIEVGEGRTNVPVGTMMSMIEQQTQIMAAVHKRLHTSQQEELMLIRDLFAENPQDLWRFAKDPQRQWEVAEEFSDLDLVPASDPNVPAQIHRIMQATALGMLAQANPQLYDQMKVQRRILRTIGISDADDLLVPPQPQGAPAPNPQMQALLQAQQAEVAARMQDAQVKQQEVAVKAQTEQREAAAQVVQNQLKQQEMAADARESALERQSREAIAAMREETARLKLGSDLHNHLLEHQRQVAADHERQQQAGLGAPITLPVKRRGRRQAEAKGVQ